MVKHFNIYNLYTIFIIINTKAIRQITAFTTFSSYCLFFKSDNLNYTKYLSIYNHNLFIDDLAAANMHINSARKISLHWFIIPLFFSFHAIDRDKPSANRMKSAGKNKRCQLENKFIIDKEKLASKKDGNQENKLSTNIESLIKEKNINQKRNTSLL